MNGPPVAALALAVALLLPASPHRRLARPGDRRRSRRSRRPIRLAGGGTVAAIGAASLPTALSLTAAILGLTVVWRHRRRARRRRAVAEGRALESALEVLVGELAVGAPPVRAFEVAAAETDQPTVAAGLATVAARARLGADVPAGLRGIAEHAALPVHWQRLAVYWQLAADHGLAIAVLMRAAQCDIAERQRFAARLAAGLAGARASAALLAGLPALGVALGELIGARPIAFLLGDAGAVLLIAGVTLACLGLLWCDRIAAP